jgi:O-acetyl-ADP-ribose deacetylase (regulator of RNase III)
VSLVFPLSKDVYPSTLVAWAQPAELYRALHVVLPHSFGPDVPEMLQVQSSRAEHPPARLEELEGDLFAVIEGSLAHCVSVDLKMGKGIATVFKSRYGRVDELVAQGVQIGGVAVLDFSTESDARDDGPRSSFAYYLVTKQRYFHKPTYDSLRRSLCAMRDHAVLHDVRSISMPRIGAGLDKLQWERVREVLREVFAGTGILLRVFTLPDAARDAALLAQWPQRHKRDGRPVKGAPAARLDEDDDGRWACQSCDGRFRLEESDQWHCPACDDFNLCRPCADGSFGAMHGSHEGHELVRRQS